jgi:hypothetical protein
MTLKDDLIAYNARWDEIEAVIKEERKAASIELRWRQLNAAFGMAKGLGLVQPDPSEYDVFAKWAKIKEKAASQPPNS